MCGARNRLAGRIESYFEGGSVNCLTPKQAETPAVVVAKAGIRLPEMLNVHTARAASERFVKTIPRYPRR
jgi:hypothetical protein